MNELLHSSARSSVPFDERYRPLSEVGLRQTVEPLHDGDESGVGRQRLRIRICNMAQRTFKGVIRFDLPLPMDEPRFLLPGFMYGRNRGEAPLDVPNKFPRMRRWPERLPASPWWMVRGDRLTNPCALAYGGGRVLGLSSSPYLVRGDADELAGWEPGGIAPLVQYNGFTCSLGEDDVEGLHGPSVGLTIGYENAPWLFVSSGNIQDRSDLSEGSIRLEPGRGVDVVVDIYDYRSEAPTGCNDAVEAVYRRFHESARVVGSPEKAVRDLGGAVSRDAWLDQRHMYSGFVFDRTGPDGEQEQETKRPYEYRELGSSAWTNGMAVAAPMLATALRLHAPTMRLQAVDCIDHIVSSSLNPDSGLPYDAVNHGIWSNRGWWFDRLPAAGHSGYLVGQMLYYVLQAYDDERRHGEADHRDWMAFVDCVVPRLNAARNGDGEYPYLFSELTGAGIDYDSFAGCWCMAACAYWSLLNDDRTDLDAMLESERHYFEAFVLRMECYGTPLDTSKAVDSEGILAYLKAVRRLHELTHDETLLDHMRAALGYEFTFKFCWNSPVSVPPLSRVGWSSCGGSITSTCNPHIHPMSSNVVGEMQYYLDNRPDDVYVASRLLDTVRWGCQTYNTRDGEYDYGLTGWMSERFCYSQGLLEEHYADGSPASTWFCLMPWASASILDGLTGLYWDRAVGRMTAVIRGADDANTGPA